MKKVLSLVLALALVLSLTATAFATQAAIDDETGEYAGSANFEGSVQTPTISVTLPADGIIVVNPYKMTVDSSTNQIISAVDYITNESDVAISVDVAVTGTKGDGSEAVFATGPVAGNAKVTTKSVFLYYQVQKVDTQAEPTWAAFNAKANDMLVVVEKGAKTEYGTKKLNVVELAAGDTTPTYAACHFAGEAADYATKAWTDDDTVNATVAFTIHPLMAKTTTTTTP